MTALDISKRFPIIVTCLLCSLILLWAPQAGARERVVFRAAAGGDKPIARTKPRTRRRLRLRGSRGEILNFQIKLQAAGCEQLSISTFRQKRGQEAPIEVRLFEMPMVQTKEVSFPHAYVGKHYDPLLPLQTDQLCPKGTGITWFWGELEIPRSTEPGRYTATLQLGLLAEIQVRLDVWHMEMPEEVSFPGYAELTPAFTLMGHYDGDWSIKDAPLLESYVREMQAHHMYPIKSALEFPMVSQSDQGPILDIYNTPDPDNAFFPITLSQRPAWAYYDFPGVQFWEMQSEGVPEYYQAIENTIPLIDRPGKAMVFLWDEPGEADIPDLKKYAEQVKTWAPSLKIMSTLPGLLQLADVVDIYVPAMNYFEHAPYASLADYRHLQKTGHEVWWYVSCMSHGCTPKTWEDSGVPDFVIDRPSVYLKSIAWLASKYDIDAFFYYSLTHGYRAYPERDPWDNLYDFTGNGDGTLFYPGRPGEHGLSQHMPITTIRLKLWRETTYDAEYLKWIKQLSTKPKWWKKRFSALVQSTLEWEKDYAKYQGLRTRIGTYLNRKLQRQ